MTRTTIAKYQALLNSAGFPCGKADGYMGPKTREALKRFKRAYAGADPTVRKLYVNGRLTRNTRRALRALPYLSPHFKYSEFDSNGDGTCYVRRELLFALEKLRKTTGPIRIVSGYRDPAYNKAIGGATSSQHLYGMAADIGVPITLAKLKSLQIFSGIGHKNGTIRHVDVRHLGPNNTTGGSPSAPTTWEY